jgi:hypothetical protein
VLGVGFHFLEDSYDGPVLPVSTFLDVGGTVPGVKSRDKLVRLYYKGRPDAADLARRANDWRLRGARVQIGNEPNLPAEGFNGTPADYARLFSEVRSQAHPAAALYWAGMSPGVEGWQDWYAGVKYQPKTIGIAAHAYGNLKEVKDALEPLFIYGVPIWVAELNFAAGRQVDVSAWAKNELPRILDWCAQQPLIEAVTYFAYRWPTPDMSLPTPVDAAGTAIERVIQSYRSPAMPASTKFAGVVSSEVIIGYAKAAGMSDPQARVFDRMMETESNRRQYRPDGSLVVSPSGAIGIGQLMPSTAEELKVDPTDPEQNLSGSARFYKRLLTLFAGDLEKATAAYNAGGGAVQKLVSWYGKDWKTGLPDETKRYLEKVRPLDTPTPPPPPPPTPPPAFDVAVERTVLWASADRLAANGYPWMANAIKGVVALSKGER